MKKLKQLSPPRLMYRIKWTRYVSIPALFFDEVSLDKKADYWTTAYTDGKRLIVEFKRKEPEINHNDL